MNNQGLKCCKATMLVPVIFLFFQPVLAQDTEQAAEDLGAITVTSPRVEKSLNEVPGAISKVGKDDIQLGQQQLTIDEALKEVPGVFVLNSYNYAQDSRIMIRGFGSRADFGIRSIKLYVDGIPSTTPDGQGGVDGIDFGSAESIEVIRGPASSLYGAAAGGVISITTEDGPPVPYAEARYTVGEYDFDKTQLKFGGDNGPLNYTFSASRLHFEGYRDHNKAENVKFNSKVRYDFDSTSSLTAVMNIIDMPIQDDPGALLLSEVAADRRQARARNLQFDGGESVEQQKLGFVYRNEIAPGHEIQLRNYYVMRNLDNKLPFGSPVFPFEPGGQIDLDRFFFGGGAQYTFTGDINQLTVGFDVDQQTDDRKEFDNLNGAKGPLSLNQEEDVNSIGIFAFNEQYLTDTFTLTGGIRYDRVRFKVTDKFFNDSPIGAFPAIPDPVLDDSGVIEFEEVSPMVGLLWSPHRSINLYSNVSTSFETPTTTEFANPAGGGTAGGFNQNLEPQTATNYEVGMKGVVPEWWNLTYNAAVFHIDIKNELVGIELANNREVFQNAASSDRDGFELGLSFKPLPGLTASLAYTYSRFKFDRFIDGNGNVFSDNDIPGIPRHLGNLELEYFHPSGFYTTWNTQLVGSFYADDANLTEVGGYGVSDLRVGMERSYGNWTVSPFMGVNNVFDKMYNSNIRLNGFGGRFYEPAPGRNIYGGMSVSYSFF